MIREVSAPKELTALQDRARTYSTSSASSETYQTNVDGSIPEFKKSNSLAKKIRERNAKDASLKLQAPRDMEMSPMQNQQQGSDKTPISMRLLGASPQLRSFSAMSNEPSLEATSVASSTNSFHAAHHLEPPTNSSSATSTPGSARPPSKSNHSSNGVGRSNGHIHPLSLLKPRNVPNLTLDKIQSPAIVTTSTTNDQQHPTVSNDAASQSNVAPVFQHFSFPKSVSTSNTPTTVSNNHHNHNIISNNVFKGSLVSPLPPFESSNANSNSGNRNQSRTIEASPKEFVQVESKVIFEQSSEQDELALENDRILNQRLLEAKALNRKDDRGAVMFKFALWGNTAVSKEAIQIEEDSNAAQPKVSSKLRGPKSVRENIKQRMGEALPVPTALDSLRQKVPNKQSEDLIHPKNIAVSNAAAVAVSPVAKMAAEVKITTSVDEYSYSDDEFDRIDEEESKHHLSTSGLDLEPSLSIITNATTVTQSTGKSRASALRTMVVEAQALGSPPQIVVATIVNNEKLRGNPTAVFRKLSFTSDHEQDENPTVEDNCFNSFIVPTKLSRAVAPAVAVTFDAGIPMVDDDVGVDGGDEEEEEEEMAKYQLQRSASYDGTYESDFEVPFSIHEAMSKSGPAAFLSSATINNDSDAINKQGANHRRRASSSDVSNRDGSVMRFTPPPLTSLTSRNEKTPSTKNLSDNRQGQESQQPIIATATNGSRNSKYQNMKHLKALQDAKHQQQDDDESNADEEPYPHQQQLYTVASVQRALLNASPNLTELSDSDENVKALIQQHAQHRQHGQAPEEKISVDTSPPTVDETNDTQALPMVGSPLKWIKGAIIGEGTFGKVYKGMNEKTGETIAIKQLYLADGSQEEVEELRREIGVMWELDHEHIVRYLGTTKTDRYLYIILEFVTGGSIASMLKQYGSFTENLIK